MHLAIRKSLINIKVLNLMMLGNTTKPVCGRIWELLMVSIPEVMVKTT